MVRYDFDGTVLPKYVKFIKHKDRFGYSIECHPKCKKKQFVSILEFDTENDNLKNKKYKIIANIPYNITGAILKKFLTEKNQPTNMVLMVQYEVAKRIIARDGNPSASLRAGFGAYPLA